MLDAFIKEFDVGREIPPAQYSPLVLAYIGDCVFELFVRTYLIRNSNAHVKELHKAAADLVVCDNNSAPISEVIDYLEKLR